MTKIHLLCIFLFLTSFYVRAAETPEFTKPKPFDFITDIPVSLKDGWNNSFNTKPETLTTWGAVIGSSVVLWYYDEKIYKYARILGRKTGLGNDDHTKPMLTFKGVNIFRGPTDTGSALQFIGDGWMQAFTAATFAVTGSLNNDNRAMQTGSQIMNAMLSESIPAQLMKRATGREDPNRATTYRGRWRPFSKNYSKDTSAYDAVPSGHLMAATSTFVVIDANYPEYQSVIRPVGISLLTLLSFQLVNIGVHWVSDYPLGLGLGYVFGKIASTHGRKSDTPTTSTSEWKLLPIYSVSETDRTYGSMLLFDF